MQTCEYGKATIIKLLSNKKKFLQCCQSHSQKLENGSSKTKLRLLGINSVTDDTSQRKKGLGVCEDLPKGVGRVSQRVALPVPPPAPKGDSGHESMEPTDTLGQMPPSGSLFSRSFQEEEGSCPGTVQGNLKV